MASGYSLGRRLLVALLGAVAAVWLATAAYSYYEARHEAGELLDAHLAQSASLLVAQVGRELEELDLEQAAGSHERARRVAFQIWERGRELRLHSASAPQTRLSPREEGFSHTVVDGRAWRVFSRWDARHRFLVQVGEREEARRELAAALAAALLAPLAVALPVLGLFIWLTLRRGLAPLRRLAGQVATRTAADFAPLAAADPPREVMPLVDGLNALLERVGRLVENERRFTADAAHELRTPLSALKTQAQVALGAADEAARRHALDSVIAGCDRATRLVEQLLTLARLEHGRAGRAAEGCELTSLAHRVVAEMAEAALARGVELELLAGAPVPMRGYPDLLTVLLRNLVDNAVRYSPPGTTARVAVSRAGKEAQMTVTDEGRGVAAEERGRLGQRFYRILGTGESGSGLGLSIARRIAELHGGGIAFEAAPGGRGLRVCVRLAAA